MSSNLIRSSTLGTSSNTVSSNENQTITDVLLYDQSKLTRKQAVLEIGELILRSNMKPKTVKHALQLLKTLLPPENTLPGTIDELFGAILSSENDWRMSQYLIRHKQHPSFNSSTRSPNDLSSVDSINLTTADRNAFFVPFECTTASETDESDSSECSDSSSSNGEEDEELEDDSDSDSDAEIQSESIPRMNFFRDVSTSIFSENFSAENASTQNNQRAQSSSDVPNRISTLTSIKRNRSDSSSSSDDSDLFYSRDLSDDETSLNVLKKNSETNRSKNKMCCFEINGNDLLDDGKRRRH